MSSATDAPGVPVTDTGTANAPALLVDKGSDSTGARNPLGGSVPGDSIGLLPALTRTSRPPPGRLTGIGVNGGPFWRGPAASGSQDTELLPQGQPMLGGDAPGLKPQLG